MRALIGPQVSKRPGAVHWYRPHPGTDALDLDGFHFACRPWALGWMSVLAGDRTGTVTCIASYAGPNPLGSIADTLSALWEGAPRSECTWELEPEGLRWTFERTGDNVNVAVSLCTSPHDSDAVPQWTGVYPLLTLSESVADAASALFGVLGQTGYLACWNGPFPLASVNRLRDHLPTGHRSQDPLPDSAPPPLHRVRRTA